MAVYLAPSSSYLLIWRRPHIYLEMCTEYIEHAPSLFRCCLLLSCSSRFCLSRFLVMVLLRPAHGIVTLIWSVQLEHRAGTNSPESGVLVLAGPQRPAPPWEIWSGSPLCLFGAHHVKHPHEFCYKQSISSLGHSFWRNDFSHTANISDPL